MSTSEIKQLPLGPMQNFIYIVANPNTRSAIVIDPAWDVAAIQQALIPYVLDAVILTHGHPDHVNGLSELLSTDPVPVYISEHEAPFYMPDVDGLERVPDGFNYRLGDIEITCIHTPGHTPGGQCLLVDNQHLITGDTLFICGCGRVDLPGSDREAMFQSLEK